MEQIQNNNGAYPINLDEYADLSTHWIALLYSRSEIVYFDSFGVEHVPEEIKEFIVNKTTIANIFPSINKRFNNVRVFLHWIHWFYVYR